MAGRKRKPIALHLLDKKKHLTKKEIEMRKALEIKIGDNKFICPEHIWGNPVAFSKWQEIMRLMKKFPELQDFITSTDTDILAMYCQTCAEEVWIIKELEKKKTIAAKRKYNSMLLKTREMKLKLQRECYLTPMSKVNAIPKHKKDEEDRETPLQQAGFSGV